jgi:hypothetical protein
VRVIEFFTANIRNKNAPSRYAHAVTEFFRWCEQRGVLDLDPVKAGRRRRIYREPSGSSANGKAAPRADPMLFDWLVTGHVVK